MTRRFDFITFDCYGTLIDWESGIVSAFIEAAKREDASANREDILAAYSEIEPVVEHETYRKYRDVLAETAFRVAQRLGWALPHERAHFLADSLPSWKPFADTNAALQRLRDAGCRLGILSNIDDDLLAATRLHFNVEFELIVTAEQVRSYKPGHAHFLAARRTLGEGASWLHAAQSNFHDIIPTNQLSIPNAWINRNGEPQLPGGETPAKFHDLARFAEWMTTTEDPPKVSS
jgi:2-haloalkanoic acid dehalogenase type II